ncbi:g_PROTEIN_RECEP_F1_2 domain-containing protein [Trichonephila clavata]|uniref:G_PROTEIN_RECEP_F1_2 domain-containing protein n=1 Tax=Trichonephila clavata TaxID=2740835 RepID=A0A8X6FI00_TRICU|nr:g_PROTEIN_RECEP_F1_2 domain-containing protein [Trichonephila clavata]
MRGLPLDEHRIRHAASRFALRDYNEHPHLDHDCWSLQHPIDCKNLLLNNTSLQLNIQALDDGGKDFDVNGSSTVVPLVSALSPEEDNVKILYQTVVPVMLTACFLSMLFNLVIVFSVKWVRRLSPTLYLSLSLAVADAYASLVIGIGLVINSLLPTVYGMNLGLFNHCYILVLEAFRLGGVVIIVLHLLALAVNHYIGILKPLHYAATVTRRTAIIAIAAMWVIPVVFFLTYFSLVPNDGFQSHYCSRVDFLLRVPFRVTTSVLFFVPLVLMSGMYTHMFILVRKHQRGLLQTPTSRQLHKNVKATITTLLILGTYILGWMPAVLYFILTCLDCPVPYPEIPLWVRIPTGIFINSMIVVKSFVDPIIYVVRMPEIKNAMGAIWRTRCGAHTSLATEFPLHSRTDIHRVTFNVVSRKAKINGVSPC